MKHLLGINDLSTGEIEDYLSRATHYAAALREGRADYNRLRQKIIFILFFEASTRTLTSFQVASKRLGANVIRWAPETSSLIKGETFLDTIDTLAAMSPDALIMRHSEYGAPVTVASRVSCPVINAGDSWREHPTQALLDALTLRDHFGRIEGLRVAIIGDIAHSRVAASDMILLRRFGCEVRVIAPEILMPEKLPAEGVLKFHDLHEGLKGVDVAITIRPQKERMDKVMINDHSYFRDFGLTLDKLNDAAPGAVVMDPGPFLRGVQIGDDLADDETRFLYKKQVANGIPTRMAVLDKLVGG